MLLRIVRRAIGLGGLLGTVAMVVRQTGMRWKRVQDPIAAHDYLVPDGESRIITTDDGAELAVTIAGEGPTVVLSHCWTGAREVWAPVANRLIRSGNRVVMYDQRGHGSSTVGSEGCTIARIGADLATVLEQLDLTEVVLAGHSMGSMTILSLAAHRRDVLVRRVRAIVLVSTAANGLGFGVFDKVAQAVIGSSLIEPAMRSPLGLAMVRGTVGRRACMQHLSLTRDLLVSCAPQVRRDFLAAMQSMDLRSNLRGLDLPTTIISGSLDALTPPWLARQAAASIVGSTLVTAKGYGHMVVLEAPDMVADTINTAVKQHEQVISLTT